MQRVPAPIQPQALGTGASVIYTAPGSTISTVANLSLTNNSGSPVSATVYNVPSGGTPGSSNVLVNGYQLSAGQSYVPPQAIGLQLAAGSTLQALCGTASAVVAQGGVYETSGSPS
jgi:hypothetical protein